MSSIGYSGSPEKWKHFLNQWRTDEVAALIATGYSLDEIANYELAAGAEESEILEAEYGLGITFPKSYRDFIMATNGWNLPDIKRSLSNETYYSVAEVDLYLNKDEAFREIVNRGHFEDYPSRESDDYTSSQDSDCFNFDHVKNGIALSDYGEHGIVLMNKAVTTPEGEYEIMFYDHECGSERYVSFAHYMQARYIMEMEITLIGGSVWGLIDNEKILGTCGEILGIPKISR